MGSNSQTQKAGNDAVQVQAQNFNIQVGIEEKRAREIFNEMFEIAKRDLTLEAFEIARKRVDSFEKRLMPKIERVEDAINSFAEPAFQFALTEAHKTAAASTRESDLELLSELLLHRIERKESKNRCAGIKKAIEIVDDISDEALLGLTVSFAIESYGPSSGNISEGLAALDTLFGMIGVEDLPTGMEWIDHLDILDAIRSVGFMSFAKYEDILAKKIPGYFVFGIRKFSVEYEETLNILKENDLSQDVLQDHELNTGYVRLKVKEKDTIDEDIKVRNVITSSCVQLEEYHLLNRQKEALMKIYDMCENKEKKQIIVDNFRRKIKEYSNLEKVSLWWNAIPCPFQITMVGKVLAHSNAKRIDDTLPNMD